MAWTKNSVTSEWVLEEAETGKSRRILIPVLLDNVQPPFGFGSIQAANLVAWNGDNSSPTFTRLVADIATILGPVPAAVKEPEERRGLEAGMQRKAEERLREQEQQRFEEGRRKAEEEKEKNRAQHGLRIMAYDVFISFKDLDEKGVPTRDAELANEVYNFLTSKGLTVFISTVTLESLGASDYKKAIDDALDAASIMVAVGTSLENLNSRWVRYEWDGFYNDILSEVKPSGKVFAYVAGLRPAQLPRALRQTQTFIHSPEALRQLYGFIVQALR